MKEYTGCLGCEHQHIEGTCDAFPEGIPLSIVSGDVQHTKPLKRQKNKIIFEPITEKTKNKLRQEFYKLQAKKRSSSASTAFEEE